MPFAHLNYYSQVYINCWWPSKFRIPRDVLHAMPTTLLHSLEGMVDLDWEKLLKLRCLDGSFHCSPASTATALKETGDQKCFEYLDGMVKKFNGGGKLNQGLYVMIYIVLVEHISFVSTVVCSKNQCKLHLFFTYMFYYIFSAMYLPFGCVWTLMGGWSVDKVGHIKALHKRNFGLLRLYLQVTDIYSIHAYIHICGYDHLYIHHQNDI